MASSLNIVHLFMILCKEFFPILMEGIEEFDINLCRVHVV